MKNKLAGILNLVCAGYYVLLYVGVFFTVFMNFTQGSGVIEFLFSLLIAILIAIPCAVVLLPAFLMLVVGREMLSDNQTIKREKLLIGLTMFAKILLIAFFIVIGMGVLGEVTIYDVVYAVCALVGALLFATSFVADLCALIKNRG